MIDLKLEWMRFGVAESNSVSCDMFVCYSGSMVNYGGIMFFVLTFVSFTQAFAGHLGDLKLAAISITNNVVVGFNFGLLLGMANIARKALWTSLWCQKVLHVRCVHAAFMDSNVLCCLLLLPMYIFASPVLKLLGLTDDVAELSGVVVMWMIPLHFGFDFQFPLQRFLQSQMKTSVIAWVSAVALLVHILVSWAMVYGLKLGVVGIDRCHH